MEYWQAMNHQERLLWLAEQEVKCPLPLNDHEVPHPSCCGGTLRVPRFPTLRRECHACGGTGTQWSDDDAYFLGAPPDACERCQGLGWVAVDNLEATLEAFHQEDYDPQFSKDSRGFWWVAPSSTKMKYTASGTTPNKAAALALYDFMREAKCYGEQP